MSVSWFKTSKERHRLIPSPKASSVASSVTAVYVDVHCLDARSLKTSMKHSDYLMIRITFCPILCPSEAN